GVRHPSDAHAHGHAAQPDHEVSHGPSDTGHGRHAQALDAQDHAHAVAHDDHGGGHGHGPWHGPHESPTPMTYPPMALALGAIVAGFVGVPAALGGNNAIEHFLEPSFTAEHRTPEGGARTEAAAAGEPAHEAAAGEHEAEPHVSRGVEIGLMLFSLAV